MLNQIVLDRVASIHEKRVLELGAGNGYLSRLLTERRFGEKPERFVVSDASGKLLAIAKDSFPVPHADYLVIDLRRPLPFADQSFDIVIACMVFNELPSAVLGLALAEVSRVLCASGRLIAPVIHPAFVAGLEGKGKIAQLHGGFQTMPAAGAMRVPVVQHSLSDYRAALTTAGLQHSELEISPTPQMVSERPGLRHAMGTAIALLIDARHVTTKDPGSL